MAASKPVGIDELFDCPVCFGRYTDPRILQCAHQFCLKCLERLVIKKPGEPDKIICPTCRHDTPINSGEEARHLPRPVLMNEVQNLLENLLGSSKKKLERYCHSCEANDIPATNYCYQCQQNMCDSCLSYHEEVAMFGGHKSVAISDYLLCKTHDLTVTAFCHQCKTGICTRCIMKDHRKHKTDDIHVMARQGRTKVGEFIEAQKATGISQTASPQVKTKVQELKQSQNNIVSQIDRIIDSLGQLKLQLEHTRNEMLAKTSADIKTLNIYEADLVDLKTSRTSLIEFGQYLIEKASDPELVMKAMEFPTLASITEMIKPPTINKPTENKLSQLETEISKWMGLCSVKYETETLKGITHSTTQTPVRNLKLKQSITVSGDVQDVVFYPKLSQLAVRTSDQAAPISVYNLSGTLVKGIGRGVEGLTGDKDLAIDSHRDLYLAPCGDHLTSLDMEGKVHDVIKVEGSNLEGVAYHTDSDQYIVTDYDNHNVVIIDAKSRKVVSSFGSEGSGNNQFNYPCSICVGDIGGKATIVVSDHLNNAVKLFDLTGHHVKTYGSEGKGDGQLELPWGLSVYPAGRVVVCDYGNDRVVSFYTEGDKDHWECLLSVPDQCAHLAIDHVNKLVAISPTSNSIQMYEYN